MTVSNCFRYRLALLPVAHGPCCQWRTAPTAKTHKSTAPTAVTSSYLEVLLREPLLTALLLLLTAPPLACAAAARCADGSRDQPRTVYDVVKGSVPLTTL